MPHRYPFAFVDTVVAAEEPCPSSGQNQHCVLVRLTASQTAIRDFGIFPQLLLVEIVAQAALRLLGGEEPPRGAVFLAGLEDFELAEELATRPLVAGDTLRVRATLAARLGKLLKIAGRVDRVAPDGEAREIAHGAWLLATE